jgi:DNA-binding FadR family transcriptional regulator
MMSLFVDPVNACLRQTYRMTFSYMAALASTIDEHQAILDAIRDGDEECARIRTTAHLERVRDFTEIGSADSAGR